MFYYQQIGKNKLNITNKDLETNEKWNCLDFIKQDYSKVDLENEADAAQLYPTYSRLKIWDINLKHWMSLKDKFVI